MSEVKMLSKEDYEPPKVFTPLPENTDSGHLHAHLKYVADLDIDISPT
jgi:hypothetical protein